ncbi:MAG: tetratricopeptide repeat protein [Chloroflexi bacterium]|nr:tetratricopeptide repeat protein [Chloroflexota bacterium]
MEKPELLERLHRLEQELQALRASVEPPVKRNQFAEIVKKLTEFVLSYWAMLSFLMALATVAYVQMEFGVDYFETYRNISATKKLGTFYRDLGERMMVYGEWESAKAAYQSALDLNPNDAEAALGTVKAQVFVPLEGQKNIPYDVANAKLDFLLERYPNDYQVYFLKGFSYLSIGYTEEARAWFQKSIDQNPNFVGGYLSLGYANQSSLRLKEAVGNYTKALELDPGYSLANNNLGFCYILLTDFKRAITHLERAYQASPTLVTEINMGDAYRYAGDLDNALAWHQHALNAANDPQLENERYIGGLWGYNFMPLHAGDEETIKYLVQVGTLDQKRSIAHYAVSFDRALKRDFAAANNEFNAARKLDKDKRFNYFAVNKMMSIEWVLAPDDEVTEWFDEHQRVLLEP